MTAQNGADVTILTLDGRFVDPGEPLLHADDLGALRGDGVFETLLVRDGSPCLLSAHLQRLARSAAAMALPAPDLAAWRHTVDAAVRRHAERHRGEAALRLIYSRGRESGSAPTAYVLLSPLPERIAAARRAGVAAVTLDRGLAAIAPEPMPWLLAGAKTLSYAVNMAALRHAATLGADDVVFVSTDGYVLEGPRSSVVLATEERGRPVLLTPPPSQPILPGTTQQALFEVAGARGYQCRYAQLTRADLAAADDVWLVSSITLAARVHTLDGRALRPGLPAAEFAALVDAAVAAEADTAP